MGMRFGDLWGLSPGPSQPVHSLGNSLARDDRTWLWKRDGALSSFCLKSRYWIDSPYLHVATSVPLVDIRFVILISTSILLMSFSNGCLFRSVFLGPLLNLFRPENTSWLCDVTNIAKSNEK
jgi:hypothetical protein